MRLTKRTGGSSNTLFPHRRTDRPTGGGFGFGGAAEQRDNHAANQKPVETTRTASKLATEMKRGK